MVELTHHKQYGGGVHDTPPDDRVYRLVVIAISEPDLLSHILGMVAEHDLLPADIDCRFSQMQFRVSLQLSGLRMAALETLTRRIDDMPEVRYAYWRPSSRRTKMQRHPSCGSHDFRGPSLASPSTIAFAC